jgi:hypothetical protein
VRLSLTPTQMVPPLVFANEPMVFAIFRSDEMVSLKS